jgi:hypothetical protein
MRADGERKLKRQAEQERRLEGRSECVPALKGPLQVFLEDERERRKEREQLDGNAAPSVSRRGADEPQGDDQRENERSKRQVAVLRLFEWRIREAVRDGVRGETSGRHHR